MGELFAIAIGTVFINNFVLSQFLGICPFIGVSKKLDSVLGMGLAVIFVMTLSSMVTFFIYHSILVPFNLTYLKIIFFIIIIAALVQLVEIILKKQFPFLYKGFVLLLVSKIRKQKT